MSKPLYSPDFFRQIQDVWARITNIEKTLFNSGVTGQEDLSPSGVVYPFAGSSAPKGYFICDGAAINRETYSDLFNVIGTTYGSGDGSTTFNLPDARGRAIYGLGTNTDIDALGENDGTTLADRTPKHQLSIDEMPSHSHNIGPSGNPQTFYPAGNGDYVASSPGTTGTSKNPGTTLAGSSQKHDHGFIVMNYIIKF